MSITPWIPTVTKIKNGEDVSAEVINPILAQHVQRAQHLYEKFQSIADKSVLIAYDQPLFALESGTVRKNSLVYWTKEYSGELAFEGLALAKVDFVVKTTSSSFSAANSSYAFGLVREVSIDGTTADVYLDGLVELDVDIDDPTYGLIQSNEIDQSANFEPGPFFLSRTEAGKMTRNPGGVAVFAGYALNRRKILFSPAVSEFSQFFTTYRFNILDRPAGKPESFLDGSITRWRVANADLNKVGWIDISELPLAIQAIAPTGAKFFYNLPAASEIDTDTGITVDQRLEQKDLLKSLPPNPPNLAMLTVNGVIQESRDTDKENGIFKVDDFGIWWFDNQDGQQPWGNNLEENVPVTINAVNNEINLTGHPFLIGDIIRLESTGVLPNVSDGGGAISSSTDYFVVSVAANSFKIARSSTGTAIGFADGGTGTLSIPQPYIWKQYNGDEALRPKMALQFIRFNPALKDALVTSLKGYSPNSNIIRFYKSDKSAEAAHGDLLARVFLDFVNGTNATSSSTAVKSLSYVEDTGKIEVINTPVISKLTQGSGILLTEVAGQPGHFIVSSSINNTTGRVNSIEPDGAELLYAGLHSYINMTVPSTLPSRIIGKILLPAGLPNADMTFVMLMLANETTASTKTVEFEFKYNVTRVGSVVNTSVSAPAVVSFNLPTPYTAKSVFKVGNTSGAIATPTLKIPASAFAGGDCVVNFELYRTQAATTPLTTPVGIVDIYWKIG